MKNLFSLLCLVVLLGVSANVMGQSTGTAPYPGATHTYSAAEHTGSTYAWSVTKGDLSAAVVVADLALTDADQRVATIQWASTAAIGTDYYVKVIETVTLTGCTNTKVLRVRPVASEFDVAITASAPCWTAVTVSLDAADPKEPVYAHGTATIAYTFTPDNNQGAYKFTYAIPTKEDFTWATPTITGDAGTLSGATGNGGTFTSSSVGGAVTLTFVVTRTNTTNLTDATGDGADFDSDLTISSVNSGVLFAISEASGADNVMEIAVTRPHTSITTP